MTRFMRGALLLGFCLMVAACGKPQSAEQNLTAENAPAAAAQGSAKAPAAAAQQIPAAPAAEPATITRVNEDGSETVEDASGDSGLHNALLAAVASTAAAATLSAPTPWQEGVNYTRLVPAQPTAVAAGQVEVLEFFWYACPHCYALDPLVEAWKKTKPAYVSFSRVPVMWNEGHRSLARLFYTLDSIGKLNDLHAAIFKEIHVKNDPLVDLSNDDAQSERIQTAFVQTQGVSAEAFKNAYHSFSVENSLQRADQLVQRYRISGVPAFVINGKYVADVGTAQGEDRLMALVSDLAAMEHKH
ncbi:MAG: thiol:disulfide interchange protein DsbA/DsbL [Steroidobacteraceae bacterium]|jgi:thiol:disulfide interchange protein DsbA